MVNYVFFSSFLSFEHFETVLKSIESQTVKPLAWYIYNDSGKDFKPRKSKVKIAIIESRNNDFWYYKRLAANLKFLLDWIPKETWDSLDYLVKVDSDVELDKDYIEKCIPFVRDGGFGAVSGTVVSWNGLCYVNEYDRTDFAQGMAMVLRREVLDYWDRYPVYPSSDTVLNITCDVLGLENSQIPGVKIRQVRLTHAASGFSKQVNIAVKRYYLRFPFFLIWGQLLFRSRNNVFRNVKQFVSIKLKVTEEERLNDKALLRANRWRLLISGIKKVRSKVKGWLA